MNKNTLGTPAVAALALGAVAAIALGVVAALGLSDLLAPKYGVIVRANNVQLTPEQWTRIQNDVLKLGQQTPLSALRDKLYRIREFGPNGAVTNSGSMPEDQMLVSESAILATLPPNFVGHAFQIGVGGKEQSKEIPGGQTNMPQAHYRQNMKESKLMIEALNKIVP